MNFLPKILSWLKRTNKGFFNHRFCSLIWYVVYIFIAIFCKNYHKCCIWLQQFFQNAGVETFTSALTKTLCISALKLSGMSCFTDFHSKSMSINLNIKTEDKTKWLSVVIDSMSQMLPRLKPELSDALSCTATRVWMSHNSIICLNLPSAKIRYFLVSLCLSF